MSNPLALAVMSYLTAGPMHRYELVKTLRDNDDSRSVKFTSATVYMVVEQLQKAGYIVEHETLRTGGYPERVTYRLTEEGRTEWRDWLCSVIADPVLEYPQFVLGLSLIAALGPDEAVALLRQRRERITTTETETRTAMEENLASGLQPLFLVDEDYRLALLAAEASFIDGLIDKIIDPRAGWAEPWAAHFAQTHANQSMDQKGERRDEDQ